MSWLIFKKNQSNKIFEIFCIWTNSYVATVWDYSTDAQDLNYMQWYPGDTYVDWWGVNIFSGPSAPNSTLVTSF